MDITDPLAHLTHPISPIGTIPDSSELERQKYGYKFLCFFPELDANHIGFVSSAKTEHYYQNILTNVEPYLL